MSTPFALLPHSTQSMLVRELWPGASDDFVASILWEFPFHSDGTVAITRDELRHQLIAAKERLETHTQ